MKLKITNVAKFRAAVLLLSLLICGELNSAFGESAGSCSEHVKDIPIVTKPATASFFSNYRNKPGSVSFESEAIFRLAKNQVLDLKQPENFCPAGCTLRSIPYMYFRSAPNKFLSGNADEAHCAALEKTTRSKPLTFTNNSITSVESLIEWIGELTQGKGKDGSELYRRCDRSCSPRYEYQITKFRRGDETYAINVSIICGAARDKDDDMYTLGSFFRWSCENPQK